MNPAQDDAPDAAADTAVVAARVDRVRTRVNRLTSVSIALGLAFTAANVQQFAAGDAEKWSIEWTVAWLLEPMVSALLLAVVAAEQVTSQYRIAVGAAVSATKWGCFLATYVMNTWESWAKGSPSGVVLHSVPPVMVLLAAEVGPALRDALARAQVTTPTTAATTSATTTRPSAAVVTDLPGEADPTADDPGQDRVPSPATGAGPPAAEVAGAAGPGHHPSHQDDDEQDEDDRDADQVDDDDQAPGDRRVSLLAYLLAAGHEVTGPQAMAVLSHQSGSPVSERTARRLLATARHAVTTSPTAPARTTRCGPALPVPPGPGPRVHLHLLPTGTTSPDPISTSTSTTEGDPR